MVSYVESLADYSYAYHTDFIGNCGLLVGERILKPMSLKWKASHDKWFSLYNNNKIVGFIAGNLNEFDCSWKVIKPGPNYSKNYRTIVEAARDLLTEAKGGGKVICLPPY